MRWLHKLLHPHCDQCRDEEIERFERERESRICNSCEMLRNQIQLLHEERDKLLDRLLNPPVQKEPEIDTSQLKLAMPSRFVPWKVKRQMLESEDRRTASLLREKERELHPDTVKLEKELGIKDAVSESNA